MNSILIKARFMSLLKNEAVTAGPASISSVGYMNPVYSDSFKNIGRKKKIKNKNLSIIKGWEEDAYDSQKERVRDYKADEQYDSERREEKKIRDYLEEQKRRKAGTIQKDFTPTGDKDADATINRVNTLGEYDAIKRVADYPKEKNKEYNTPVKSHTDVKAQTLMPEKEDYIYSSGIPKEKPEERFFKDAAFQSLRNNIVEYFRTGSGSSIFKPAEGPIDIEIYYSDDHAGAHYVPETNTIRLNGKYLDRANRIKNPIGREKYLEDRIMNSIMHETEHYAQFLGLSKEEKEAALMYSIFGAEADKVPFIEKYATLAEEPALLSENAYFDMMSDDEKKFVLDNIRGFESNIKEAKTKRKELNI